MAPSHRCIGLLTIMSMIACVISCADDTKRRGAAQRGFLVRTSTRNWGCCAFVAGAKGPDVCLTMKPVGKPDAGNPHVRFDERGGETERCRMAPATAPVLDSTAQAKERRGRRGRDLRSGDKALDALCRRAHAGEPGGAHASNGLERPCGRSRPTPRRLASLVVADAFAGALTRGSIGTIPETAETENTRSYQKVTWLMRQSAANRALKRDSLLTGKRTGNFVKIGPFGKKPPIRT